MGRPVNPLTSGVHRKGFRRDRGNGGFQRPRFWDGAQDLVCGRVIDLDVLDAVGMRPGAIDVFLLTVQG